MRGSAPAGSCPKAACACSVCDDGPGLPAGVRPGLTATSLGFQLVPLLAEQLQAPACSMADAPGACFDIDFDPGATP